ncbi:MAG TPA: hypothetical protein VHD83_28710 [Puia sp.]|nr:hypothetical protein [Puia sp.]
MVDLTLFHDPPGKDYSMADSLNRRTGRLACYLLEWTGWYNHDIAQRLLGHYRLFQVYKKDPDHIFRLMPLSEAYILHYRSTHQAKYILSKIVSLLYSIGTLGRHYLAVEIETFNRSLINYHAHILQQFLDNAEEDFTSAFHTAMEYLHEHLLDNPSNNMSHQITAPRSLTTPNAPIPSGKPKGVFSKKQILILFDLLTRTARMEKLDLTKPNKYDALAELFHALTDKSMSSWKQELNDYKHKDLYAFHTQGELNQLIAILSNMAELFRKAGFRSIAALADKKIRELEQHRRN